MIYAAACGFGRCLVVIFDSSSKDEDPELQTITNNLLRGNTLLSIIDPESRFLSSSFAPLESCCCYGVCLCMFLNIS
ncbi:hypothetical protein Nepgr_020910 [Nepenthes gracilis]|uniref:Uncharacterized protein n=1 Tax=Nepenthes gracilis TaxID=150966 RepID=A0AAD3SYL5_NEPGR|nr:hypothetical protein Nepgr_020910 [Nepenthes gracilis]